MLSRILSRSCFSLLLKKPSIPKDNGGTRSCFYKPKQKEAFYDVEGVVKKDTLLFRYEDDKVKRQSLIGLAMLPIGVWMAYSTYYQYYRLEDVRKNEGAKTERLDYLLNNVTLASQGVGIGFLLFYVGLFSYWTVRTTHTVRKLVLRKGGKMISLQTYGVFGGASWITMPVSYCTRVQFYDKFYGKHRFLVKIRDHSFNYHFNLEDGVFSNKALFERTMGMSRNV